jgi:hypothetical protein
MMLPTGRGRQRRHRRAARPPTRSLRCAVARGMAGPQAGARRRTRVSRRAAGADTGRTGGVRRTGPPGPARRARCSAWTPVACCADPDGRARSHRGLTGARGPRRPSPRSRTGERARRRAGARAADRCLRPALSPPCRQKAAHRRHARAARARDAARPRIVVTGCPSGRFRSSYCRGRWKPTATGEKRRSPIHQARSVSARSGPCSSRWPTRTERWSSTSTGSASRSAPTFPTERALAGSRWPRLPRRSRSALVPPSEGRSAGGDEARCALTTEDIEADHATLWAAGVDVDAEIARTGKHTAGLVSIEATVADPVTAQFFFRDIDGNRFLIVQPD